MLVPTLVLPILLPALVVSSVSVVVATAISLMSTDPAKTTITTTVPVLRVLHLRMVLLHLVLPPAALTAPVTIARNLGIKSMNAAN